MSAEKGPKHIYAEEHQLYYYYYNFEEHLVQKQEHFATSETRMTRWLRPAGSNMLVLRHLCALVFFRSILTISPFLPHLRHMDLR